MCDKWKMMGTNQQYIQLGQSNSWCRALTRTITITKGRSKKRRIGVQLTPSIVLYPRFHLHPWLPSSHPTITLSDLLETYDFCSRICWWLTMESIHSPPQHTQLPSRVSTSLYRDSELKSTKAELHVFTLSMWVCSTSHSPHLVSGETSTNLPKPITRFFLYCSISLSFCLPMATKTYLLIF